MEKRDEGIPGKSDYDQTKTLLQKTGLMQSDHRLSTLNCQTVACAATMNKQARERLEAIMPTSMLSLSFRVSLPLLTSFCVCALVCV